MEPSPAEWILIFGLTVTGAIFVGAAAVVIVFVMVKKIYHEVRYQIEKQAERRRKRRYHRERMG